MSESATTNPFEPFFDWMRAWTPPSIAAPANLEQSILSGLSLVSINTGNSAAPDTERAVLAKASYGRQLGRLIDAVEDLIAERGPDAGAKPSFEALHDLAQEVATAKLDAAKARLTLLRDDLALLERSDPEDYRRQKVALAALLATGTS